MPRVEGARAGVWALLATLLALRGLAPDLVPPVEFVVADAGCRLGAVGTAPSCPCGDLPASARRVLGLPVSLARADAQDLELVPGIGPARARAITQNREREGAFATLEALDRVPGIGPATVRALRPHLFASGPDPACSD